ncbi:MAG TPA: LytTR family DNA-binding domain-containing protein [Chitinophagaceae bacterium]|nr:LytTR family DNA-binding domain-containing protein [Chitinophagaceae bacterium]
MNVLIIEDEKPAYECLLSELKAIESDLKVVASFGCVRDTVQWLNQHPSPDLIFMDVQLSDGPSFNIFKSCNVTCPVIFTTAYDKYLTEAFEYNSIDYILKPIDQDKLKGAMKKYKGLQQHFLGNYSSLFSYMNGTHEKKRTRVIVKRGMEFQAIRTEDIVYFFTEHKLIFLVDKDNRKYMAEASNLAELEAELDSNMFYRANRKFIVNANYIRRFKPLERSKISVELTLPLDEEIVVSQENSSAFKKWISEI